MAKHLWQNNRGKNIVAVDIVAKHLWQDILGKTFVTKQLWQTICGKTIVTKHCGKTVAAKYLWLNMATQKNLVALETVSVFQNTKA